MELDLTHVRSFLAVVDTGGYHRAAEALHLSQPSVSAHVRRLEQTLGGTLFERDGRGVRVSDRGERAAAELRELIAAHDRAVTRLTRTGEGDGPFVLGIVEHLVDPAVPSLLAALREHLGPGRPLQMRVERSADLVRAVRAGEVDAAVVVRAIGAPYAVELDRLPLFWFAAPELVDSPLQDPVPLVAYTEPCGLRDRSLAQVEANALRWEIVAESPHLSGIEAAVRAGMGYALLAAGSDGMRRVRSGPLAEPNATPLSLVLPDAGSGIEDVMRRALWNAALRARPRAQRAA